MNKIHITAILFLLSWLFAIQLAVAQTKPLAMVGIIWHLSATEMAPYHKGLIEAMQTLGWVEGKNVRYFVHYMEGDPTRVPQIIKEFVTAKVDVIYLPDQAIKPAREVTKIIPIVTGDFYDPVLEGFTASLAKPNQNVTGVSWQTIESAGKRVELAKELVNGLKNIAYLYDSTEVGAMIEKKGIVSAARISKVELRNYPVQDLASLRAALAAIKASRPGALIVSVNPLLWNSREEIARFASAIQVPAIAEVSEFASAGFVLTNGVNPLNAFTRGAYYLDKILRGAKPSELPIEQPTKFDFVINLKTAKTLGIKIPESIMLRATEVIR